MTRHALDHNLELQHLPLPPVAPGAGSDDFTSANEHMQANAGPSLPPADNGGAAWRILLSSFLFEALLWGFPLSFGVFQDYYTHSPQFKDNPYVSVVGTVASGLTHMAAPIIIPLTKRWAKWRRLMIWIGCKS